VCALCVSRVWLYIRTSVASVCPVWSPCGCQYVHHVCPVWLVWPMHVPCVPRVVVSPHAFQ
jgi:hypothetical protein